MPRLLTQDEIRTQVGQLEWEVEGNAIRRVVELPDFAAALDFVVGVGHEAEAMNHHPDIDIRWNTVTLTLSTHSEGGLTQLDIELAHRVDSLLG